MEVNYVLEPYDVLGEAEAWVEESWTQGSYIDARRSDLDGISSHAFFEDVVGGNPDVEIFGVCSVGAMRVARLLINGNAGFRQAAEEGRIERAVLADPVYAEALRYLWWAISGDWQPDADEAEDAVDNWNEDDRRTKAQVLAVFRKAKRAALDEERGKRVVSRPAAVLPV